ncbi:MAG: monovalent cation:proton antiporter-2 (CPA2) family protein [bacterium]
MDTHGLMFNMVVYLSAAVIAVPVFARLGLGSVLGYLVAGVCIGPFGLGLISNVEDILHFSEFGVVLLLFLIGLELEPRKLWNMRRPILGTGGLQVLMSAILFFVIALLIGLRWQTAIVAGLGLALSSTAIALQILGEKNLMGTPAGRTGFSVLLFQDIAVIPIIAVIPLLGFELLNSSSSTQDLSTLTIVGVIAIVFTVGRFVLHHVMTFVASIHLREVFTALSLLLVFGIAMVMDMIGVSMALGAFVAGVLMADSPYRHALESDIEPFKGLLLGLFFISVGMSMDFALLFSNPASIFITTLVLMAIKAVVLNGIARVSDVPPTQRWFFTFLLCQGGEFGFVLFGFASAAGAMEPDIANQLILSIALSMALTPVLMLVYSRFIEPSYNLTEDIDIDHIEENENPVIIIGFGRFGQIVARLLFANRITPTLIDHNPEQLERVRRFGYQSYYGDALRLDVLQAAGIDQCKIVVLAVDDPVVTNQAVELIRSAYPHVKIMARAYDRGHAMELIDANIDGFTRETFYSALEMGKEMLSMLGHSEEFSAKQAEMMRKMDLDTLYEQVNVRHDEKAIISIAHSARENLEQTLSADISQNSDSKPVE